MKREATRKKIRKIGIALLWLIIWQLLALWVNNAVLLAGPMDTLKALGTLITEADFMKTLLISCGKLTLGLVAGVTAGAVLGTIGVWKEWVDDLLRPVLSFLKSVPVAAFVVLLLIWWGSKWLSVGIVFAVVFPQIYFSFSEGLRQVDKSMLEVAGVYKMSRWNQWFYLYRRALEPFLDNGLGLSLGLSWKSGVAAEVIGTPDFSIGEGLYMAKTHLNTPGVFAWIIVILLLSAFYEKAGMALWHGFAKWKPKCRAPRTRLKETEQKSMLNDRAYEWTVSKTYGEKEVWQQQKIRLEQGKIYTWQAPSGRGKTTLLRILAGLETNQEKEGNVPVNCSMVFQEDRLLLEETPLINIEMVLGSHRREEIHQNLCEVIPELNPQQTCGMLSGGMKRRVCLVRAMLADSEIVFLDEPFAGLDEKAKKQMTNYILKMQKGRCVVVVTHQETDKEMLNSIHWKM